jgi:signal peptidase I
MKSKKKSIWNSWIGDLIWVAMVAFVIYLLHVYVLINARIPSESMQNTIMIGDRIYGNRLAYINHGPKRYDIVIFHYPDDPEQLFIKRVIGLPGDKIDIHDGKVYVNDSPQPLTDSFCPEPGATEGGNLEYPFVVPEDSYFMLGDNRLHSKDSRYWQNTFVQKDQILAKAVLRYWPLNKFGLIGDAKDGYVAGDDGGDK